ncbi:MAG: hypothetical protein AAB110_10625 [Candidatus Desantisbacteria bacterium]
MFKKCVQLLDMTGLQSSDSYFEIHSRASILACLCVSQNEAGKGNNGQGSTSL